MNYGNFNQHSRVRKLTLALVAVITMIIAPVCAPLCAARTCDGMSSKLEKKAASEGCHEMDSSVRPDLRLEIHGVNGCISVELTAIPVSFAKFEESGPQHCLPAKIDDAADSFSVFSSSEAGWDTNRFARSPRGFSLSSLILRI